MSTDSERETNTNALPLDPSIYTVVWFAPLEIEARAAICLLDHKHNGYFPLDPGHDYVFQAGGVCGYNVVIATFPAGQEYGTSSAAALASQVKVFFPNLQFGLLIGVGAGFPDLLSRNISSSDGSPRDIRLGDVLVALSMNDKPAIVPYGLGKQIGDDGVQLLRSGYVLSNTKTILRSAIGALKAEEPYSSYSFLPFYESIKDTILDDASFLDPGQEHDHLYNINGERVVRERRSKSQRTRVWYGAIGSGDTLMKSAQKRMEIRDKYGIIGVEMEAAGIMNHIPVAVIRGVCDYGDEYKNKRWQPYAAAIAGAYAKAVLSRIPPSSSRDTDSVTSLKRKRDDEQDNENNHRQGRMMTLLHETFMNRASPTHPSILHMLMNYFMGMCYIPRTISSKIIISDFLGRELHFEIPIDWDDLGVILLPYFDTQDRYGFEKVRSQQFIISFCDGPEKRFKRIGPSNWADQVQSGRKFYMSAIISHLQLHNQVCTACRARVRKFQTFLMCPNCGLFCLSAQSQTRKMRAHQAVRFVFSLHDRLRVPNLPYSLLDSRFRLAADGETRHRHIEQGRLTGHELYLILNDPDSPFAEDSSTKTIISDARSAVCQDSGVDERTEDHDGMEDKEKEEQYPIIETRTTPKDRELRERELEEVRHFKNIFIQEDTLLYDAALRGDYDMVAKLVARLKQRGISVDANWGPIGSPLVAAITSWSDRIVIALLRAGADPFAYAGPLDFALRAAAVLGNINAVVIILEHTIQHNRRIKLQEFQDALDKALYSAVDAHHHSIIPLLLYTGANPFVAVEGNRSAFAMVAYNSATLEDSASASSFVTEAYGRGLLKADEARPIIDALYLQYTPVPGSPSWLDPCCRNLEIGRTEGLEKRIANRLMQSSQKAFFSWNPFWRGHSSVYKRNDGDSEEYFGKQPVHTLEGVPVISVTTH